MKNDIIIERFLEHNFHDALLRSISVVPPCTSRHSGSMIVILEDRDAERFIEVKFISTASVEFIADFDVLKDNALFGNTSHTEANSDRKFLVKRMRQINENTNIEYSNMPSPVDKKVANVNNYKIFRIVFMGGILEVIAKNVKIMRRRTNAFTATAKSRRA